MKFFIRFAVYMSAALIAYFLFQYIVDHFLYSFVGSLPAWFYAALPVLVGLYTRDLLAKMNVV